MRVQLYRDYNTEIEPIPLGLLHERQLELLYRFRKSFSWAWESARTAYFLAAPSVSGFMHLTAAESKTPAKGAFTTASLHS